jgi:hypothetical protein
MDQDIEAIITRNHLHIHGMSDMTLLQAKPQYANLGQETEGRETRGYVPEAQIRAHSGSTMLGRNHSPMTACSRV